ncbi:hypothetical protein [Sphingobium yanoikuyae]|jgi:predicted RNA methylase|uniref:hypothetical protein n=1 Tax=Sphingobium yanoikuyae TaxID=13690 RepID=UPI0028A77980|nr:hypothetical protein [Sphingobium yanoikuyae]
MARLSKAEAKLHREACDLVALDRTLTLDEREFVINHWQESATHVNSAAAAFFTPLELAFHLAIEANGCRTIIDLCAGIGALSYAVWQHNQREGIDRMVCVEINPEYAAVGRKVLPEAEWIVGSVDELRDIGQFDLAISNPPFGKVVKIAGPRYCGEADLAVIDIASDLAEYGVFIIPQMSCPFEYSGVPHYKRRPSAKFDKFHALAHVDLQAGCGVDCDYFRDQWRGVSPRVEIACADFSDARAARRPAQADMFSEAA